MNTISGNDALGGGFDGEPASAATSGPWRVLVVEDHQMMREGIVALLRGRPECAVVGMAGSSREARRLVEQLAPDLVLLDFYLGDSDDGETLIRELVRRKRAPRVLVLSMHREDDFGLLALRAGAAGFISKTAGLEDLCAAMRTVLAGERYVSEALRQQLLRDLCGERDAGPRITGWTELSERERQVFRLIGAGRMRAEIARTLSVSAKTVDSHREGLKNKLACQNTDALTALATEWYRRGTIGRA